MITTRLIIAVLLPFFMSLQTSPNRKPPAVKVSPPPAFAAVDARVLGENYFGVYLFDKKNVGMTK